jgi:hypothetical protein
MGEAKRIKVRPIAARDAARFVQRWHYSRRVVPNSQIHLGAFLDGRCGGVLQFGPPMMRRQMLGLVRGTAWSQMLELNRLAFADWMPRNGESRSLAVALRILRKHYPALKWVLSFADGVQCGDGTIYRAAGFVLTQIRRSDQIRVLPDGTRITRFAQTKNVRLMPNGAASAVGVPLPGYMMRYIYFLHPAERANLTVPEVPYARIRELGAGMYRGKPCAGSADSGTPDDQSGGDGAVPIPALHSPAAADACQRRPD